MQLTAKGRAYLCDCARRYAPQDTDLFEADVFDGVRVGMLLGDAIVEAWGAAARRSMTRLIEAGPTSAAGNNSFDSSPEVRGTRAGHVFPG
jgi:hypothetical protein